MFKSSGARPSRRIVAATVAGCAMVIIAVVATARGARLFNSDAPPSAGLMAYLNTIATQTMGAFTPDPTVIAGRATMKANFTDAARSQTQEPTRDPAHAFATASAAFELADRLDGVRIAEDILLRLDPRNPEPYEDFIVGAARYAVSSPIPFPFSGDIAPPDPEVDLDAYRAAVYTDAFEAACEHQLVYNVRYELCARDALIDFPTYTRALIAVDAADAIPLARTALQSPNKLVVDAAILVLCVHQDVDSIPVIETRLEEFVDSRPDIAAASGLLACDTGAADDLALSLLEGDEALFDALEIQVETTYGPISQ